MSVRFDALRRLLAGQIEPGSWGFSTTTALGPVDQVTCSSFAMDGGDVRMLDGGWLYFCDGTLLGAERAIAQAGLTVAGGDIVLGNDFSAVTPSGAVFEVHLRYPVTDAPGGTPLARGYRSLINDSLRRLWFEDEISVSGVSGQQRYLLDITTHPWLADRPKRRVLDVMRIDTTTNVKTSVGGLWEIDDDAEAPALIFRSGGFNTGDTFYLKVARPCHTRIKIGSTWTDVSPTSLNNGVYGLYADTDECHAQESDVVAMAISEGMNALGMRAPQMDKAEWESRRRYWATVARGAKNRSLPRKNDGRLRLTAVGLGGGMMGRRGYGWGGW